MKATVEDLRKELWLRLRDGLLWETKDGKRIPLKEMTTEHIINAIKHFERNDFEREIVVENMDSIY